MNSKLYVGNLSPSVTEADLRFLFSRIGAVTEVDLKLDPATHQSRGYAFVTMATPELAAAALRELHSYNFGGRYIAVTEARPPQDPKALISAGFDLGPSALSDPASRSAKTDTAPPPLPATDVEAAEGNTLTPSTRFAPFAIAFSPPPADA